MYADISQARGPRDPDALYRAARSENVSGRQEGLKGVGFCLWRSDKWIGGHLVTTFSWLGLLLWLHGSGWLLPVWFLFFVLPLGFSCEVEGSSVDVLFRVPCMVLRASFLADTRLRKLRTAIFVVLLTVLSGFRFRMLSWVTLLTALVSFSGVNRLLDCVAGSLSWSWPLCICLWTEDWVSVEWPVSLGGERLGLTVSSNFAGPIQLLARGWMFTVP